MNDRRFIELLNLYLDHQLKPEDAAALDATVKSCPARRRTYEEYCQLQRGCSQLGSNARAFAPLAPRFVRSIQEVERKITAPRKSILWYPLQLGGLATVAMAAGFALVVLTNPHSEYAPDTGVTNHRFNAADSSLTATRSPHPRVATITPFTVQPAQVALGLGSVLNTEDADNAAPDREALEWMQRVDALPAQLLVLDEQTFTQKAMVPPDTHVVQRTHSLPTSAEFTEFQLSR